MEDFIQKNLDQTKTNIIKHLDNKLYSPKTSYTDADFDGSYDNSISNTNATTSIIMISLSVYKILLTNVWKKIPLFTGKKDGTNRAVLFDKDTSIFRAVEDGRLIFPYEIFTQVMTILNPHYNPKPVSKYGAELAKLQSEGKSIDNIWRYYKNKNFIGAEFNGTLVGPERLVEACNYCVICGKVATSRCGGCLKTYYCSKECQKQDWKSHKLQCNK